MRNCALPHPLVRPVPSLNDFDFDVVSTHTNRIALHSFPSWRSADCARLDVEMGTVPRADHFFADKCTFRQRPAAGPAP